RASPKTQSALLEVMEEGQVTVGGSTHQVERPFVVIATQNPIEQAGTYRLPEAQLDRFLIKTALGYPDREAAMAIAAESERVDRTAGMAPVTDTAHVNEMIALAQTTFVDTAIIDYVERLCEATRSDSQTSLGVSMRGVLALIRCAKVWAPALGRAYVTPDDIKSLAPHVLAHRVIVDPDADFAGVTAPDIVNRIIAETVPPAERVG
ncbi:MAG: MoxR family ATPase, partial [Bifidobacteriaceae bacterium]|nr:MoxR family ATPase [Bifidobacteriaceae bacterium]